MLSATPFFTLVALSADPAAAGDVPGTRSRLRGLRQGCDGSGLHRLPILLWFDLPHMDAHMVLPMVARLLLLLYHPRAPLRRPVSPQAHRGGMRAPQELSAGFAERFT